MGSLKPRWWSNCSVDIVHVHKGRGLLNDYLSLLPATFAWIAKWLSARLGGGWPLWIGAIFPVYAAVLSFGVWILRGRVWPVRCLYPWTKEEWPCDNWVAGEWYRCHKHNTVRRYKHHGGHWVDPSIPRWKIGDYSQNVLVDRPIEGIGFVSVRPASHALLYRKGYARRPSDVLLAVPQYIRDCYERITSMRLRDPAQSSNSTLILGKQGVRNATAEHLQSVVGATQFALITFASSRCSHSHCNVPTGSTAVIYAVDGYSRIRMRLV